MTMNPDQVQQLLASLAKIAEGLSTQQQYTITGAVDYPILVAIGSILVALAAFMWVDLRNTIKDNRGELREELTKHINDDERDHEKIWKAFGDCQSDCCPRDKR